MEQFEELKLYIRNILRKINNDNKKSLRENAKEEYALRKIIRKMLSEVKETSPHELTGINVLEKLLGNIIPVIETGYKSLTTDIKQRESYSAHILSAVQNLLAIPSLYFDLDKGEKLDANTTQPQSKPKTKKDVVKASEEEEESVPEQNAEEQPEEELTEQEGEERDPDAEKFIDINKDETSEEQPVETKPDPISAFQEIEGEDHTGRSFALETFKKVQKQILESYSILSNSKDREIFEEYLITNLRLYLDRFEKELSDNPPKPTTPSYEAAKNKEKENIEGGQQAAAPAPQPAAPPEQQV
jgi:hypothetical protein